MLNKISNETLQNFFERKTHLNMAQLTRNVDEVTVILEDCNKNYYVAFKVTDTSCKASPRERLGNMATLWNKFLEEQTTVQNFTNVGSTVGAN